MGEFLASNLHVFWMPNFESFGFARISNPKVFETDGETNGTSRPALVDKKDKKVHPSEMFRYEM